MGCALHNPFFMYKQAKQVVILCVAKETGEAYFSFIQGEYMVFERFYPTEYYESAYVIDYDRLYAEGYRCVIYDVDNTLVEHGAPADERALKLMSHLMELGFKITFLSNNKEQRVKMFNEQIGTQYIYKAGKPKIANYLKAVENMGCTKEQALFVGDQLFTDVWGANRAGIRSALVVPINTDTDEIQIVLKRKLERIVLKKYLKKNEIIGGR